jgi:hypothetical protein
MPSKSRYPREERKKRVFPRSKKFTKIPPTVYRRRFRNKKKRSFTNKEKNIELTMSPRVYKHYKLNRKIKGHTEYKDWKPKISKLLATLKKHLIENESGVFIENFGYFFIMRHPKVKSRMGFANINGEGRRYTPMFAPIRKDGLLNTWCIDHGVFNDLHNQVQKKVAEGYRYQMAYSLLYSMYGNKNTNLILAEKNNDNTEERNSGS